MKSVREALRPWLQDVLIFLPFALPLVAAACLLMWLAHWADETDGWTGFRRTHEWHCKQPQHLNWIRECMTLAQGIPTHSDRAPNEVCEEQADRFFCYWRPKP
jgi:hypothetical protein